ncbi:PucR family transcriptional regulator [Jatrophihabitans fulvus]
MLPTLRRVLELPELRDGAPVLRAGAAGLDQPVRWVHVAEVTDIAPLLEGGELILTTGIALPAAARAQRQYVRDLAGAGVRGVVVELGRRFRGSLPDPLVGAAEDADLPLVELHREVRFVAVTQAVHAVILDVRMREIAAQDDRQRHRTVLTGLLHGRTPPLSGERWTAAVLRGPAPLAPAALRELADAAADTLGADAVVALLDDAHVGVLLSGDPSALDGLDRLADPGLVVGIGFTVTDASRAGASLREAVRVADLAPAAGCHRAPDLRLAGLLHQLRDHPAVAEYVERELGALLARPDVDTLLPTLAAYCRCGGSKTDAAAELFISRAALYDRLRRLEAVLGVDLAEAGAVVGLHVALLAREARADGG